MSLPGTSFGFWHRLGLATGTRDDSGPVDFSTLERRVSLNDSLIAPADLCRRAKPDAGPPVFSMPAGELRDRVRDVALAEPRTMLIEDLTPDRLRFVQRSRLMQYPDIIDAMFVSCGPSASTVALFSRSLVGRSDLGVNRERLERWLQALVA